METRNQIENMILQKAMKEDLFRSELIANPKMTLEKEFGIKLPDSIQIRIMEEKSDTFYLVLPAKAESGNEVELTEHELQTVAAGGNEWYDQASDAVCEYTPACLSYAIGC